MAYDSENLDTVIRPRDADVNGVCVEICKAFDLRCCHKRSCSERVPMHKKKYYIETDQGMLAPK